MSTTYRRRMAGAGGRTAGHRKSGWFSAGEERMMLQLGASLLLFLLVFAGRGVLPDRMTAWGELLRRDMDLGEAAVAFGRGISEGGDVLEALERFWSDLSGSNAEEPLDTNGEEFPTAPSIVLPTPRELMEDPLFGSLPSLNGSGPDEPTAADPDSARLEEPSDESGGSGDVDVRSVVTAVAQDYNESGEKLPDNVSFQYYDLGLAETAVPVVGNVTSAFGFRDHPVSGEYTFHTAQDIGTAKGTDVRAFADGTVRYIGENGIYGRYVRLDHDNGVSTFYAHCQKLLVSKGDTVTCGQVIAKSGDTGNATGPHLHFSIDKDGIRLDPAWYLDEAA